jgi:PAS domain S-box-containing protein
MQSDPALPNSPDRPVLPGHDEWLSWFDASNEAMAIGSRTQAAGSGPALVLRHLNRAATALCDAPPQPGQGFEALGAALGLPAGPWADACEQASRGDRIPPTSLLAAHAQRRLRLELAALGAEHVIAVLVDVTEQHRLEVEQARRQQRSDRLLSLAQIGSWELDIGTGALRWSAEMYRVYGLAPSNLVKTRHDFLDRALPEDRAHSEAALLETLASGEPLDITHRVIGAGGTVRHVRVRGSLQHGLDGQTLHLRGTAQDITTHVTTEHRLLADQRRMSGVLAALSEGLVVQAADGQVVEANPAALELLGLTRDQILGRTSMDPRWQSVYEDGSPCPGEEHPSSRCLRSGAPLNGQVMGIDTPGRGRRWLHINANPILGNVAGAPIGVVTTFVDITDQRSADNEAGAPNG